jgi:hypothetical protein
MERFLTGAREGLIRDIAGTEENLTAAQAILIDRAIGKLGLLRCIEEHVRETGVMHGHKLSPALSASYLSYSNSLRLDLQALGIERKQVEPEMTLAEVIREIDEKKAGREAKSIQDGQSQDDEGQGEVRHGDKAKTN